MGSTTTTFLWDREAGLPKLASDGSSGYLWDATGVAGEMTTTNAATYALKDGIDSVRLQTDDAGAVASTRVNVPAFVIHPNEPLLPPLTKSRLRRGYPNLQRYTILDRGGHFLALENADRLVAEIRNAFRLLRLGKGLEDYVEQGNGRKCRQHNNWLLKEEPSTWRSFIAPGIVFSL